jgi:acetylornithine deacetylase
MDLLHIVKAGGKVISDAEKLKQFLKGFQALPSPKILVHGGGKTATELAEKLGIPVQMHQGRRITDKANLDIALMVYGGLINSQIVAQLQGLGCKSLGISGAALNIIEAKKRTVKNIDYGFVGDIINIDNKKIAKLIDDKCTLVFAPLTADKSGQLLNTNADTIAAELAAAMTDLYKVKLHFCFEKKGVLLNEEQDSLSVPELSGELMKKLLDSGVIKEGMTPKLENGFRALKAGVSEVSVGSYLSIGEGTKLIGTEETEIIEFSKNLTLPELSVHLLKKLIKIPSFSREEKQTAALLSTVIHELTGKKATQKHHNLWIKNKYYDPELPTLLLCSHHDTVKQAKSWTKDPFDPQISDGKLYGLGSNDAGASLLSLLSVFYHYYEEKNLPFNLIFAAVAEEEISGKKGIASILKELGKIDLGIIGEPTEMQMAIAEKGLMVLDCCAKGKTGHAARKEGINAISVAREDIAVLENFQPAKISPVLGEVNIAVTQIQGGYQHNVIPDNCNFVVDVRSNEMYSNKELCTLIQDKIQSEVKARSYRLSASGISMEHPIVKRALNLGLKTFGSSTLSDQALLPFPTVKIGPGDSARSHTADEYIKITEIEEAILIYIYLIKNLKL